MMTLTEVEKVLSYGGPRDPVARRLAESHLEALRRLQEAEARVPLLGEIAEKLREWKARGVTLESLNWVIGEQVYFDEMESGR